MFKKLKKKIRNQIRKNQRVESYLVAASIVNGRTFSKYKDANKGKEVAICGAGPTFAKYIPLKGVKHVALNRALLNEKIKFDYFIADDFKGVVFMQEHLINYDCIKLLGHQIGSIEDREIPETLARKCGAERYYTDSFMVDSGYDSVPVTDIDCMPVGNMPNIALEAMQIILYTNPKRIYLVGCDASASGHYTEKGVSKKQKDVNEKDLKLGVSNDKVIACWHRLKDFIQANYPDIEIVSVNPVGLKGIFIDSYQKENGELEF